MWYAKMYFSEDREIFQYDSLGTQGVPDVQKEFPFLERLLSFQELDCAEVTPILQSITDNWSRFIAEDDRDALENVRRKLGRLDSMGKTVDELRKLCPNADWKAGKLFNLVRCFSFALLRSICIFPAVLQYPT